MVCSRLPQRIVTLHSLVTNQNILHGIVQCMSHMKLSCDIWWRHHNREWLFAAVNLRMKISIFLPFLIQTILYVLRIISLA